MKKSANRYLLMAMLFLCSTLAFGQAKKTVSGTVRDASGTGLPGVSINEKGSKTSGVISGDDGGFSITVSENATLVFTSVGFNSKEVKVGSSATLDVELEEAQGQLSEVVVTGFGVRKQARKLSYSVQEVGGEELARVPSTNVVNALQGKVAGVMINQGAGGPSSSSRIRIRGNASVSKNNTQPLFVIDGVLIKPGVSGADSWGDARDFGNELKNLNPDDYESLTVLKGSAATALYGSEAQFGVILITTKKGKARKGLGVTVSNTSTFEKAYRTPDYQNEYGGGINTIWEKDTDGTNMVNKDLGPYYSFGPKFDGSQVRDVDGRMIEWKANDLLDLFRTGQYYNTNVAVEGGSDKTTFRLSYTNTKNNSVMPNNSFKRNVFNVRATQKINSWINLDATVTYANSDSRNPILQGGNSNPLFRFAYSNARHYDIDYYKNLYIDTVRGGMINGTGNPNSNPYLRSGLTNVLWNYYENNYLQEEENLRANLDITANITPWLNLLVRSNINSTSTTYENKQRGQSSGFLGGYYGLNQSKNRNMRLQALLSANRQFGQDFDASVSLGGETNRGLGGMYNTANTNGGFKVADIYSLSNSVNAISANGYTTPGSRLDAAYIYGDVTWRQMLTLNFSARNDWNSTLTYPDGSGQYSYLYPSVGLAWVFSEMLANKASMNFLSFGKLRASLGYTGAGTDIFYTSTGIGYGLNGNYTNWNGTLIPSYGFRSYDLGNFNLKPERSREIEFGADLRFFDGRIGLDVSWYKKNTFNQIMSLGAPGESGISSRIINAGNIQNQGVEIMLSATPVKNKNLNWTTSFNFSRNRNKIIDLDSKNGILARDLDYAFGADVKSIAKVGGDFGTIVTGYGYATYQKKDANGNPIDHPSNGKRMLKQSGVFWRSQDIGQGQKEIGSMLEKFLLSNINDLRYKDFSLFVQVDAKIGGMMASATHQYGSQYGSFEGTLPGRDLSKGGIEYTLDNVKYTDGIIPDGVFSDGIVINGVDVGGMSYADAVAQGLTTPMAAIDYYDGLASWGTGIREYSIFENSWIALREVSIGYNIPTKLLSKVKINNFRVSLIGRNLMYLYNSAKDGINPESIFSSRSGAFAEYGGLPYIRTIGISLNAGF
ncbi:MAG: SusC/RagA family TonB-linked outer membrane protein [Agriterribacter sp.]